MPRCRVPRISFTLSVILPARVLNASAFVFLTSSAMSFVFWIAASKALRAKFGLLGENILRIAALWLGNSRHHLHVRPEIDASTISFCLAATDFAPSDAIP